MNGAKSIVSSAVNGIKKTFSSLTDLVGRAGKWGSDLINGFVRGIRNGISAVGKAVKGIADKVRSFLHFSEPDVGPLSDFHTYAPDMLASFANGIKDNIPLVTSAVSKLADMTSGTLAMAVEPSPFVPGTGQFYPGNSSYNNQTTVNIYATPEQNAKDIADEVIEKLNREYRRKKVATT